MTRGFDWGSIYIAVKEGKNKSLRRKERKDEELS
jgi:hypothetical protein